MSRTRPKMSRINRAAQFAPFAALTGHDRAIEETAASSAVKYQHEDSIFVSEDELFMPDDDIYML